VENPQGNALELMRKANWAIDKVTRDIAEDFQLHTAIAAVMELVNDIYRLREALAGEAEGAAVVRFAIETAASLIFPFAPHVSSEVFERLTGTRVWEVPWPEPEQRFLERDTFTLVVQVNGKLRAQIEAPTGADGHTLLELARSSDAVARHVEGREIVKEIVVPGKLVNLVVR
jgi:leucyl-tRNA synthetase